MTYRYHYLGTEPTAFVTVGINGYPGETIESDVPLSHPLLELFVEPKKSAVVPETNESPVSADDKEN